MTRHKRRFSVFPKVVQFPANWIDGNQKVARIPDTLQVGKDTAWNPPATKIRKTVGRTSFVMRSRITDVVGIYSIGADDPVLREYRSMVSIIVDAGRARGYPENMQSNWDIVWSLAEYGDHVRPS